MVNLVGVSSTRAAQDALALRRVFETVHFESCPTTYNFHLHTVCSDGQLTPETVMHQAIAIGLQGLSVTDHHTLDGYYQARAWLAERQATHTDTTTRNLRLWTGIEVTAKLLGVDVHILGYAFDPTSPYLTPYLQHQAPALPDAHAAQVIRCIQVAGGLAVLAHPARYRRSPEELIAASVDLGIDGVETYYAYDHPKPWRPSPKQTEQMQRLSSKYGLLNTCGTDTHGSNLLQRL